MENEEDDIIEQKKLMWSLGFFEGQSSFSVGINLVKTKNRRYVVFKPVIVISNTDDYQIDYIKKILKINNTNPTIKKRSKEHQNDSMNLQIQNFSDIDNIISIIGSYSLRSKLKQEKLDKFIECYEEIKNIGHIHTSWDDKFEKIIEKKLEINLSRANINKNRFDLNNWIKKIKEHLESL